MWFSYSFKKLVRNKHSPGIYFSIRASLEMIYRQTFPKSRRGENGGVAFFFLTGLISRSSAHEKEEKSAHLIRFDLIQVMKNLFSNVYDKIGRLPK